DAAVDGAGKAKLVRERVCKARWQARDARREGELLRTGGSAHVDTPRAHGKCERMDVRFLAFQRDPPRLGEGGCQRYLLEGCLGDGDVTAGLGFDDGAGEIDLCAVRRAGHRDLDRVAESAGGEAHVLGIDPARDRRDADLCVAVYAVYQLVEAAFRV